MHLDCVAALRIRMQSTSQEEAVEQSTLQCACCCERVRHSEYGPVYLRSSVAFEEAVLFGEREEEG